jgi:hypothetical protein
MVVLLVLTLDFHIADDLVENAVVLCGFKLL